MMRFSADPFLNPMPAAKRAERVAVDTLEVCLNKLDLKEVPLPVPIEEWIEHPLGYEFGVEDLRRFGDGVLGASYVDEGRIVVDPSVTRNEGRLRFTVAHELGHMLLHRKRLVVFKDTGELHRGRDAQLERQADRFAAAMLMPLHLVLQAIFDIAQEHELDPKPAVSELMLDTAESERLWRTVFITAIMKRFGVSRAAAINRFLDLRIRDDRQPFIARRIASALRHRDPFDAGAHRPTPNQVRTPGRDTAPPQESLF